MNSPDLAAPVEATREHRRFPASTGFVALMLASEADESLWRTVLASQGVDCARVNAFGRGFAASLRAVAPASGAVALIADLPYASASGLAMNGLAARLAKGWPALSVYVRLPSRVRISASEQAWARAMGLTALLPGETVADWNASITPALALVLRRLGIAGVDLSSLHACLRTLMSRGEEPRLGPVKDAYGAAYRLEMGHASPMRLYQAMQGLGGVPVDDRFYRGITYRECFIASQALDWLQKKHGLARELARVACNYLCATGHLHHVVREQPFSDGPFFFRFAGHDRRLDGIDLVEVQQDMRGPAGVQIASRSHLGKSYADCFVGCEAVDWLRSRYRLSVGEAEAVGQRLLEVGVIHHVLDEHGFSDARFFYRFRGDEFPDST